jgi:tetratricopeptide (TPR) repeat protein
MDEALPPVGFLDVPTLLEASGPRPRVPLIWYVGGGFLVLMLSTAIAGQQSPQVRQAVEVLSTLVFLAMMAGLSMLTVITVRKLRAEQVAVEGAGELVQLRRWPQAAWALQGILSQPCRTHTLRAQALIYLASVLTRYHRFDDAIAVQNYLLEHELTDPSSAYGLRLGRAMAMLREDHLLDADRAISELRRTGPAASAGLALIEIFRHVKTGHPEDAVQLFEDKLTILRDQLGHRVADAWALIARAYDLLGRETEAADAFRRATLLAPLIELRRRYPEVEKLVDRYQAAQAPAEMA